MSLHSAGSSCTRTPSRAAHLPATMLSANKSPPLPLGLEICRRCRQTIWEVLLPDQRPVRYMAPLLEYLFPSSVDLYRRGRTISRSACGVPPQFALSYRLLRCSSSDFPYVLREQT